VFDAGAIDVLRDLFAMVGLDTQATRVEMDGEDDHVHLLIHDTFAVGAIVPPKDGLAARSGHRALFDRLVLLLDSGEERRPLLVRVAFDFLLAATFVAAPLDLRRACGRSFAVDALARGLVLLRAAG